MRMVSSCTSPLACCLAHCPFQENDVGFSRDPSGFFDVPSMLLGSVLGVFHWHDVGVELPSQV